MIKLLIILTKKLLITTNKSRKQLSTQDLQNYTKFYLGAEKENAEIAKYHFLSNLKRALLTFGETLKIKTEITQIINGLKKKLNINFSKINKQMDKIFNIGALIIIEFSNNPPLLKLYENLYDALNLKSKKLTSIYSCEGIIIAADLCEKYKII